MSYGPKLPLSEELHIQKYRQTNETFEVAMKRIAKSLADTHKHKEAFLDILLGMRFLPAGRVQAAIGAPKRVTPYNCFVSGTIEDSFVAGDGNIMQRATEAAATMRMGGGIGYDFSKLRPRGNLIRGLDSQASGPVSFMQIFDSICKCIASSGHRRGAQMGILRVDHPDIEAFVQAKSNTHELTGFNISIAVTDKFMEAVQKQIPFELTFEGRVYKTIDAVELWEKIMRTTWDWAEPGVVFIDRINEMNNLYYCETIAATNPCAEQPLPPNGACLLGSFNLTKYIFKVDGSEKNYRFDWKLFEQDIPEVTRALDNVVDAAVYPLHQQEAEAKSKRRMGLGITGLANAVEALGYPYGSLEFLAFEGKILDTIRDYSYAASAMLAKEKGSFPLYDERFLAGKFLKTLNPSVLDLIKRYGIRNSHLTSIAPTGTISLTADNISSSIEPVFNYGFDRTIQTFNGPRVERIDDYGFRVFGVKGKIAKKVTASEHVAALVHAAKRVDSAVSKTCNVSPKMAWDDFKHLYVSAWEGGAKGCTTFNSGGKRFGILVAPVQESEEAVEETPNELSCAIDVNTGRKSCE